MTFVAIQNVSRYYGTVTALDGVNAELKAGDLGVLIGANGAGKSTLLQCLAGVQIPDTGSVFVGGWDLRSSGQYQRCTEEHQIGYLPQEPLLYADLTIFENLELIGSLCNVEHVYDEVMRLLEQLDITWASERRVRHCSQGVVRRAGLARALLGAPALLLLDEPFAHLDEDGCERLRRLLIERQSAGTTICVATHLASQLPPLGQRTFRLDRGRLSEEESQTLSAQGAGLL